MQEMLEIAEYKVFEGNLDLVAEKEEQTVKMFPNYCQGDHASSKSEVYCFARYRNTGS